MSTNKRRRRGRKQAANGGKLVMQAKRPANPSSFSITTCPGEMDCLLNWNYARASLGASGFGGTFRIISNTIYNPLVPEALSAPQIPGKTAYFTLYNYFRVIKFEYQVQMFSKDGGNPSTFSIVHMVADPGNTPSTYPALACNPYGRFGLVNDYGAPPTKVRGFVYFRDLLGSTALETDQVFAGDSATNPTDLFYFGIAVNSVAGATLTNGVDISMSFRFHVRFYDRKNLTQ